MTRAPFGQGWPPTRMGRRRLLATAGAGVGAAALLAACGRDGSSTSETGRTQATAAAAATPKRGGELLYSLGVPTSQTLDPHTTLNLGFFYWGLMMNKLLSPHPKTLEPLQGELVEGWEQIDKDTLILRVRQGVTWHEGKITAGRPFVARDVAYNLERIIGKYDPQRAALFQRATLLAGMDRAEAVDERTVRVAFKTPNAAFLAGVADWRNWPVPEELVQKDPNFTDPKNFTGTGPFIIDGWDASTATGHYVANGKYWKPGRPYVAGVQQISFPDSATAQAAFLSGKTDFITASSPEARDTIARGRPDAKIIAYESLGWDYLRLNQGREMFRDPRARRAIFLALDYNELLEAAYGSGFWDYCGPLVSGLPGAWTSAEVGRRSPWNAATKAQDIAQARQLMDAAGFPGGRMTFSLTPSGSSGLYYDYAVRIKDQLERVWPAMKVNLTPPADGGAFSRTLGMGDYDAVTYISAPGPNALLDPAQHMRTGGGRNYTKFSDPKIDQLVEAGFAAFDTAERNRILAELQQAILEVIFIIPLGKGRQVVARQKRIQGFDDFPGPGTLLQAYDPVFAADQLWIA
jgi:peptide/nickel transport system substrate-binding protein